MELSWLIGSWWLIIPLLICLLILAAILYARPAAIRRRQINQRANHDYQQARGTSHQTLLREALRQIRRQETQTATSLIWAKEALDELERQQAKELYSLASRSLVENHLKEISGIGPKLQRDILHSVYRNDLRDLHHSHRLPGIGAQKQAAISHWVRIREQQMPSFLKSDFQGKSSVVSRYRADIAREQSKVMELELTLGEVQRLRSQIEQALRSLDRVSKRDFRAALGGSPEAAAKIEPYLKGAFAEWEPTPDWFRRAMSQETQ